MDVGQRALRESLVRARAIAWATADYQRAQRDEYTSKLRFGLVALNAVSLLTVLNLSGLLAGLGAVWILIAAAIFVLGTVSAGYSLFAHQTHLIEVSGATFVHAMTVERAATLAEYPPESPEYDRLGETLEERDGQTNGLFAISQPAYIGQSLSAILWLIAVLLLAAAKVASLL